MSEIENIESNEPASDKEQNLAALRKQRDELLAEVRPLRAAQTVRAAGFDPETGNGKALAKMIGDEVDPAKVLELAGEFGWQPTPTLTPAEQAQVAATDQRNQIQQNSISDDSSSEDDIDKAIQEARANNDFATAVFLENRKQAMSSA